jgi:hypothetical protein
MPVVSFDHDRRQILIPVAIMPPSDDGSMHMERVTGLIDTGATRSGVSRAVASALQLPRAGKLSITTPQGDYMARLLRFTLGLFPGPASGNQMPFILDGEFLGIESSPGAQFDVLIGMDVIGVGDLTINRTGTGSFSF